MQIVLIGVSWAIAAPSNNIYAQVKSKYKNKIFIHPPTTWFIYLL